MAKRGNKTWRGSAASAPSAVEQLRAALTRSLKNRVAETVGSVCEEFEEAVAQASAKVESGAMAPAGDGAAGYDHYYSCCQRLVSYISDNMATSPDFAEQMDRIILACHSGATERVLNSVVTKDLWFHTRDGSSVAEASDARKPASSSNGSRRSTRSTPIAKASEGPKKMKTRASMEPAATRAAPATRRRNSYGSSMGKRMGTRGSERTAPPTKRPRRAAARASLPIKSSDEEEEDEEEEDEEEEDEEEVKPAKTRKAKKSQPHWEEEDELLPFKDAIGELCYPDRRTPTQTKFFKDRLRKSIQFVDALLCKPPTGHTCGRDCKKIRAQMCSSSTPCKNKMCRIWHDVEAHTDRCQNPQCEFKNRIMLRETMHKVELKKQQLVEGKAELQRKRAELNAAVNDDNDDREQQIATTLLEDEIAQLEHDLNEGDEELSTMEATKKTFWAILNDIGIELRDDVVDEFPDFATHYVEKPARKARTPQRAALSAASSSRQSTGSRRSERASRRLSAGPHGDDTEKDNGDAESDGDNIPRRTARRSTSGGPHGGPMHPESDEETKGEQEQVPPPPSTYAGDSAPRDAEAPPVTAPLLRQNPEFEQDYPLTLGQSPEFGQTYASASGYSIHPPADDLEAPAITNEPGEQMGNEESAAPVEQQQPDDVQRAGDEVSGIMEGFTSHPPPVGPPNSTGFTIRGNQQQSSCVMLPGEGGGSKSKRCFLSAAWVGLVKKLPAKANDPAQHPAFLVDGVVAAEPTQQMAQRNGTGDRVPDMKHGSSTRQLNLVAGQSAASPALHERQASLAGAQLNTLLALARNGEDGDKDGRGVAAAADLFEEEPLRVLDEIGGAQGAFGDSEPATSLPMDLQIEMLRGKLSRRNQVLEVIRRAYYRDVIVIKEELRQHGGKLGNPAVVTARGAALHRNGSFPTPSGVPDGRLSSVPSVDLRDVLQLFAPSETVLQVHPCESCGGHLELVHGESKELTAARQEMARASKGEQQMRAVVHRMRSEAKQMEEVNDALQQRVKALLKENAYTLEQVQASRKNEREQKVMIASMRSKLQLAQATQEEIDRLSNENKDIKQQLIRSNHDRDIFSASNNHLKEELAQVTKALHVVKVEKAQIESDFGTSYYRLQEETKKSKELTADLAARDVQLKEKAALCDEQHHSLTSLKEELASTLQRFEQTKRHLEDQLIEEERAREEMQEQNFEFRRMNKKLMRDLENLEKSSLDVVDSSMLDGVDGAESHGSGTKKERPQRTRGSVQTAAIHGNVRRRLDDLHIQLEWASMRENDLAGMLVRQATGSKPPPLKRTLSRMPSKTIIARTATSEPEAHRPSHANAPPTGVKEAAGAIGESTASSQGEAFSDENPRNAEQSTEQPATLDDMSTTLEINEKNFEAYHKEVARMLTEVEEGKDRIAKQQKVITDLERKNHSLGDRLEESKLSIEALTGSVNALKMRLNQDSAGAAEQLEAMMLQIEENKRDQLYEMERGRILMTFLRHMSESVHDVSDNKALLTELDLELVPPDDSHSVSDGSENGTQMAELQRKKREVRRKVLMDKAMKKFSIMCHNRSELISVEMKKLRASVERLREDLDQAENKIDSDQLHIRTLEAEIAKLRLTVEMGKNALGKTERALKQTTEELNECLEKNTVQAEKFKSLTTVYTKLEEDQKRLTMLLFEKTKAWQKEISANDKCNQKIEKLEATIADLTKEQEILQNKLDGTEQLADFRRRTNRSVEVSAIPETTETEMQTDRWKPQGLLLRQRNGPDRLPQRYLGKASVVIHCPELDRLPSPGVDTAPVPHNQDVGLGFVSSLNATAQHMSTEATTLTDTDEHLRGLLELKVYPSAKVGGRQIKTSYASSRPKALSRLYLSSDGISQKYIAPMPRPNSGGEGQQHRVSNDGRPYTSL